MAVDGIYERRREKREEGENPVTIIPYLPWVSRVSAQTRDGTAEPVSRDQIPRCERGQGRIDFHPVDTQSAMIDVMVIQAYIRTLWCVHAAKDIAP